MSTLSEELSWRGFINQTTFGDIEKINQPRTFYWGVDPSADSMHIGNLAPAMMIRHLINHGHKAILLVGGATGMVGDPDGKKQERDLKTIDEIAKNKVAIAEQYKTVFAGQDFEIVDNYEWFKNINYLDFLRDVGKHASMTQMLDRDFVQSRIGKGGDGISYAEFSYSLIQGYDFLHLYREKGATLQVAGADQWGNSISGVQLIRRLESSEAHVMTAPLVINRATGRKFGKTEDGAVWLDPQKTSPYKFYQFWLNTADEMAEELIKIYTLLDRQTIESIIAGHRENSSARELQKTLAREVTTLVHGNDRTASIENVNRILFSGKGLGDLLQDDEALTILSQEVPSVDADTLVEALVEGKIASSNKNARQLIEAGAITLNGEKQLEDCRVSRGGLVRKGKNTFLLISNVV